MRPIDAPWGPAILTEIDVDVNMEMSGEQGVRRHKWPERIRAVEDLSWTATGKNRAAVKPPPTGCPEPLDNPGLAARY